MPFGLGIWEVAILLAVVALLFGTKGVPDVARRLGLGLREIRDAVGDVDPRRMLDAPPQQHAPHQQQQQHVEAPADRPRTREDEAPPS